MSRIYNKHMDQVIRSVEPTLGQEKTKAFKRNLETKKMLKKGVIDPTLKAEEVRKNKAKGGRVGRKGGGGLGAQSVKYGLDNKPEVTKLDRIAKFIAKDKKKKNKKFKTPMDQAVKKDKKNKRFV